MKDYSQIMNRSAAAAIPGTGAKFNRFLANIELTTAQKKDASERLLAIRLKMASAFPGSRCFVVGSYGKNTAIKPPSDLDIMLVLPQTMYEKYTFWKYLLSSRNAQSEFLQEVKRTIDTHFPVTELKADRQVIVVKYASSFSVEIVPCFEIPGTEKFRIADTKSSGNWVETNPYKEAESLTASNKNCDGNTVPLIKMLKSWKRNNAVPLKSFYLEILAQEFMSAYEDKACQPSRYDLLLKEFYRWLYNKSITLFGPYITDPSTDELINIGSEWHNKAERALDWCLEAMSRESKGQSKEATEEWQKIFGKEFIG